MSNKSKRIILVGKAGSGKDFFRDHLHRLGFDIEVSYTTRPPRVGEVDGYTYNYVSRGQFENLLQGNNMFEHVEFAGMFYGTTREHWETKDVFIFTPSGLRQVPEDDRAQCFVVFFDIPQGIRRDRLKKRSDWDSVERRIAADEADFAGFCNFDLRVSSPMYDPDFLAQLVSALRSNEI